ncbi:Winged helix-turn-helix DNA-binding domain protein [Acididesulfobacillus acetoxydans]|uniref:Winged helix-turn-helix DNA-binding domain protein n=2 Tax=Acididesulfobacillus acetoxydans TaxID=1561005 RepID=A0A8S0W1V4_9FIRM|nr:DUF6429 family protein [Acididesulfobacillus acetoxydans]CAA7599988.1 Winged helix-turn-helix DNA-binding domain protein [Acididesulfobacillus acetoxydans]CAA7599992.1 Winged helix-turn-helix DNA-binding domain protein [Acididesulfobacillus acetoxydans]CEJ05981.1 Hypothetical protein DEACI_0401 [Acididesulfobacillus acetoxydans]
MMDEIVKELTLLLMYLTSWKEDVGFAQARRTWKGYPFETINKLTDEELISGSQRSKSVYLTDEGVKLAEQLGKKYLNEEIKL